MNKRLMVVLVLVLLLLPLIASIQPAVAGEVKSDKDRITSPDVSLNEQASLVEGNSAFGFELYQALKGEEGNLFYSPYSISLALAMTYAGARGETAQQMAATLHFILEQERLHPAFNWLDAELASRGEGAQGQDGEDFRLNIVNAIWGQKDYEFLTEFLDVLAEIGADGALVRFFRVGCSHQLPVLGDGTFALEHLHHHRAGNHEFDQILEKGPAFVHRIKALGLGARQLQHARGDKLQAIGFKAGINLADDILGHCVGLDDG